MKKHIISLVCFFTFFNCSAQTDNIPFAENAKSENRVKEYRNLVNSSINKNLSLHLTDSTEENWQDAFYAMELINHRSPWADNRIRFAFDSLEKRSIGFQRAYLELIYTNYPKDFVPEVVSFLKKTGNSKLFAMCAEYIFMNNHMEEYKALLIRRMNEMPGNTEGDRVDPFFTVLLNKLLQKKVEVPPLADFLTNTFLSNEIILFSFQRKNRNYPGLAMVRGKDGVFIKDENGNYFNVPQLARSITNMPGYITNGNTPQGIFKMTGFDVSKGSAIGPTTNIQMIMPFEKSIEVADSIRSLLYTSYLLPRSWKDYYPIEESYLAGMAGRTEIIAHGTTVNPEYYKNQPYYPLTPTLGCLATKEIWSAIDGKRTASDQQKLVNAVKAAGGADGYCIVIEIDDQQKPVSIDDILPYLNKK